MVWLPGQRLYGDRYTIKHKIGEGGFGVTYLAKKEQSEQQVVIKTLKDELLGHKNFADFRDRLKTEALTLYDCKHPNIVEIDKFFIEGNLPCIAMEYVAGEDLWNWVEKRGILSEIEALNYIRKVGEALIFVHHEKGLLHRDIKPQNIMLRDNHDAVLIDFGLARDFFPDRTQQITFGLTHGFAPPEQYVEIGRFAESIDVYALAATLYYLLTKIPPTASCLRALNHPLKPPFQLNSRISSAVNWAILKGMEMDAKKRPQSVQKWLDMLSKPVGNAGQRGVVPLTISSAQPQPQPVKLISAKGVDYAQLDRLLASRKWKEADEETTKKMLEVTGRTSERYLRVEDIDRFPCEDLRTIDQLWVKYSNGRFGFSVQKRVYESLGGTREYDEKIWQAFGDRVGWREMGQWNNSLKYNIKVEGNLPGRGGWGVGVCFLHSRVSLVSRLVKCNI